MSRSYKCTKPSICELVPVPFLSFLSDLIWEEETFKFITAELEILTALFAFSRVLGVKPCPAGISSLSQVHKSGATGPVITQDWGAITVEVQG